MHSSCFEGKEQTITVGPALSFVTRHFQKWLTTYCIHTTPTYIYMYMYMYMYPPPTGSFLLTS